MELYNTYMEVSGKTTARTGKYNLNILSITDSIPQSIARQEFLGQDGAVLYNLGLKAREIKFKAFFFGDQISDTENINPTYMNHFEFINAVVGLNDNVEYKFSHPKYGIINCLCENISVMHDDTQEYAEVEVTLIEQGLKTETVVNVVDAYSKIENIENTQIKDQVEATNTSLKQGGFGNLINVPTDITKPLRDCFRGITQIERNFLAEADSLMSIVDGLYTAFDEISIQTTLITDFGTDVTNRILGSMTGCLLRMSNSFTSLANSPAQVALSMDTAVNNVARAFPDTLHKLYFQNSFTALAAARQSTVTAELIQKDQTLAPIQGKSFNAQGQRVGTTTSQPMLSSTELDLMVYVSRARIQEALETETIDPPSSGRENKSLRNMAAYLQDYVNSIKLKRMKISTISVSNQPLHLILSAMGQSYQVAEVLLKINPSIKNPTFTEGLIKVYQ